MRVKSSENALAEKEIPNIPVVCIFTHHLVLSPEPLKQMVPLVQFIFAVSHAGGAKQHHHKRRKVLHAERLV